MNVQELDRRAVLWSVEIVSSVGAGHLDLPTPCSEWDLRSLLTHMISEHRGFAAAADGETSDTSAWREQPLSDDPAADYAEAAEVVIKAFSADDVLGRRFWLPKIRGGITIPGRQAVSFHALDYVVHGWDVAATLGLPRDIDEELVRDTLRIAKLEVPDKPQRALPGASFRPALPIADDEPPQSRMLRLLGRSPDWSPPNRRRGLG
jgi:uncharacterized protein (TIGR03086 family)